MRVCVDGPMERLTSYGDDGEGFSLSSLPFFLTDGGRTVRGMEISRRNGFGLIFVSSHLALTETLLIFFFFSFSFAAREADNAIPACQPCGPCGGTPSPPFAIWARVPMCPPASSSEEERR